MALVGFKARNHKQQVAKRGANPKVDDRATPPELFDPLNARFQFTLDVCALPHNAKCANYYTPEQNGLEQDWRGVVWCNPPYSDIRPWIVKAWEEFSTSSPAIVMLVPANRTEQAWWQDMVEPFRDRGGFLRVEFLRGRQRFIAHDATEVGKNERPPFGCCLLIWSLAEMFGEHL